MAHYSDLVSSEILEPAIYKACLAIEAQAVDLCPVDKGQLRNSIMVVTSQRSHGFNEHKKLATGTAPDSAIISAPDDDMTGVVGTGLEYAAAVEFGRPDMPAYPAQPYLRPAALIVKSKIGGIAKEEIAKGMEKFLNRHPFTHQRSIGGILGDING
jgi:hypothetical protein